MITPLLQHRFSKSMLQKLQTFCDKNVNIFIFLDKIPQTICFFPFFQLFTKNLHEWKRHYIFIYFVLFLSRITLCVGLYQFNVRKYYFQFNSLMNRKNNQFILQTQVSLTGHRLTFNDNLSYKVICSITAPSYTSINMSIFTRFC